MAWRCSSTVIADLAPRREDQTLHGSRNVEYKMTFLKPGVNFWPVELMATEENFSAAAYLLANPDVAAALERGSLTSAREHLEKFGRFEGRKQRDSSLISTAKKRKHETIRPTLAPGMTCVESGDCFDFLTDELRRQFNILDTASTSSNGYDRYALELIDRCGDGLVLDCGAGRRDIYFDNVVNFEIVRYDTTDVVGVGEMLPFRDNTFDAVLSLAVLEHVKDPFTCAQEISRVLKPGGKLICCVPFLQPYHGYPHHYYNMTHQGIANLFAGRLMIDKIDCYESVLPIWSLSWILNSWCNGLHGKAREEFENLRVRDLLDSPKTYLDRRFVRELSAEKNLELASATVLFGHKKPA
jgi:SAM-dependent methyltransferase